MNAFDLISFSSGLDLSGFFVDTSSNRERFASTEPADEIMDRVKQVGKGEGLVVKRESEKGLGAVVERQNEEFILRMEIYRLTDGVAVVEVEKGIGAAGRLWKEKLRPANLGL
ncbi:unnamed protein product [Musa banksii]